MPTLPNVQDVIDQEFLELRARLLQAAAQLDRIDRAGGSPTDDGRLRGVHQAIDILAGAGPGRAEKVQMIFSRPYDADWKETLNVENR